MNRAWLLASMPYCWMIRTLSIKKIIILTPIMGVMLAR